MSFSTPYTFTALELLTAAKMNAIQTNISAIWVGTTASDMEYYTSSSAKTRLAIGSNGSVMRVTSGAPAWLAPTAGILTYDNGGLNWRSGERYIGPITLNSDIALTTGDQKGWFFIPPALDGWNITYVAATRDAGGTGIPTIQLRNITDSVDTLTTKVTIDSTEVWSGTAATPPVIDLAHDDVANGDRFAIDVDVAGTNTLDCQFLVGFSHP